MKFSFNTAAIILAGLMLAAGCRKDETQTGYVKIRMQDNPAVYNQVNVEILLVRVHIVEPSGNSQWVDLPTNSGIYDLLTLQNGIDTSIVNTTSLPAGVITQMRLILGSNNTVMADSVTYDLATPSGQTSGVKLVGNITIPGNDTVNVLLDFVVNESIVEHGNGDYHLKPVIKVIP
jgi:hypothetical protein